MNWAQGGTAIQVIAKQKHEVHDTDNRCALSGNEEELHSSVTNGLQAWKKEPFVLALCQ